MRLLDGWRRRREGRLCGEVAERVQELVDAEISPARKQRQLERHVELCLTCGASAEELRELKDAIARVSRDPDPELRQRLLDLVDDIRQGSAGHDEPPGSGS